MIKIVNKIYTFKFIRHFPYSLSLFSELNQNHFGRMVGDSFISMVRWVVFDFLAAHSCVFSWNSGGVLVDRVLGNEVSVLIRMQIHMRNWR